MWWSWFIPYLRGIFLISDSHGSHLTSSAFYLWCSWFTSHLKKFLSLMVTVYISSFYHSSPSLLSVTGILVKTFDLWLPVHSFGISPPQKGRGTLVQRWLTGRSGEKEDVYRCMKFVRWAIDPLSQVIISEAHVDQRWNSVSMNFTLIDLHFFPPSLHPNLQLMRHVAGGGWCCRWWLMSALDGVRAGVWGGA